MQEQFEGEDLDLVGQLIDYAHTISHRPIKTPFPLGVGYYGYLGDGGRCDGSNRIQLNLAHGVSPANHDLPLKFPAKGNQSLHLAHSAYLSVIADGLLSTGERTWTGYRSIAVFDPDVQTEVIAGNFFFNPEPICPILWVLQEIPVSNWPLGYPSCMNWEEKAGHDFDSSW